MTGWQRHTDPPSVEHLQHPLPAHLAQLSGTRIVQISDLHVGRYFGAEIWAGNVARIRALQPDLVVITGDAMDWSRRYEGDYLEPLRELEARHGVLAILGNHDFYFGARRLEQVYAQAGQATLLRGERWSTAGLPGLHVWGIDDPMTNLSRAASYPELGVFRRDMDPDGYHLLLSHRPDSFAAAAAAGFHLQLSGHTHGGQLNFRTRLGAVGPAALLKPYDRGTFDWKEGAQSMSRLYVNRGLGYTAIPYRHDCSTEITVHELRT